VSTPPTQAARVKRHHEQQLRTELTARVARHQACPPPGATDQTKANVKQAGEKVKDAAKNLKP